MSAAQDVNVISATTAGVVDAREALGAPMGGGHISFVSRSNMCSRGGARNVRAAVARRCDRKTVMLLTSCVRLCITNGKRRLCKSRRVTHGSAHKYDANLHDLSAVMLPFMCASLARGAHTRRSLTTLLCVRLGLMSGTGVRCST